MLNPKNKAAFFRLAVLTEVAKSFINNDFADADKIPEYIVPDDSKPLRGSLEQDRKIARFQSLAAMGFTPCNEDYNAPLSDFARKAIERKELEPATVSVLPEACNACMKLQYTVTDMCRGCVARPCETNCPKKAITVEKQAHINQSLCIRCGLCHGNCPYGAINKAVVPCEVPALSV